MIKEFILKTAFNLTMERYGHMFKLDINPEDKTITAEILLKGEVSPIEFHIGHYEVLDGPDSGIKVSNIHTSREWMTELIHEYAPEHVFKFNYSKLLKIIF